MSKRLRKRTFSFGLWVSQDLKADDVSPFFLCPKLKKPIKTSSKYRSIAEKK